MTQRKQLTADDAFHPDTRVEGKVVGFYSVEDNALTPWYECILLGRTKRGQVRTAVFRDGGAQGLHDVMCTAGWDAPDREEIARLCESAGRYRSIVRDPRFTSEVKHGTH